MLPALPIAFNKYLLYRDMENSRKSFSYSLSSYFSLLCFMITTDLQINYRTDEIRKISESEFMHSVDE